MLRDGTGLHLAPSPFSNFIGTVRGLRPDQSPKRWSRLRVCGPAKLLQEFSLLLDEAVGAPQRIRQLDPGAYRRLRRDPAVSRAEPPGRPPARRRAAARRAVSRSQGPRNAKTEAGHNSLVIGRSAFTAWVPEARQRAAAAEEEPEQDITSKSKRIFLGKSRRLRSAARRSPGKESGGTLTRTAALQVPVCVDGAVHSEENRSGSGPG